MQGKESPLKFVESTRESSKFNSANLFYRSGPGRKEGKQEMISEKIGEAREVLEKAKESLRNMRSGGKSNMASRREWVEQRTLKNEKDITMLECEMQHSVRLMEKEIKELTALTCELLEPGYYRRNKYPHNWRLSRSYLIKN